MLYRVGRWLALLIVVALWNPLCRSAELGSSSPAGTVRLASGPTAHYEYHYNRNALADLARAGDALIARTDSGNLLRFDRATLKVTKEWFGPVPVTCLGRGEDGAALAGFADGRIVRVDPASLATTELGRVPGKVRWVATMPGAAGRPAKPRLIAVAEQTKSVEFRGKPYPVPFSVVHDLGSGKTYAIDPKSGFPSDLRATTILLDHIHRLWLGADNGEWGGWCSYVDLDAGQVHSVAGQKIYDFTPELCWPGVFGFTELRDGQVWAHGGTTHMGDTEGFIWRVDRGKSEGLYRLENFPPRAVDGPDLPVTHIVEDPRTGAIAVVSFSDIYRTDARLARWQTVHRLEIRYRGGRRDAMGTYPSVRSVRPVEGPGQPMAMLFATRLDGLVRLADGKETGHSLPGQLGAESVGRIESSTEGILVFDGSDGDDPWRLRDGAWSPVSFAPAFVKDPEEPALEGVRSGPDWSETRVLVGRDGAIFTVNESRITPGTRTTARWRNGKAEVLGWETSSLDVSACFLTPDGQLWNARNGKLRRLVHGLWIPAAEPQRPPAAGLEGWIGMGWGLRAVNDAGPPWILHGPDNRRMFRLAHGTDFKDPRLEVVPLTEGGQRLNALDAIAWTKTDLLLATNCGLRAFAIDGGKLSTPPLNTGGRTVSHLVRDGRGRLWLGGEGLAVLEADGRTLHSLDALPMLGRSKVVALAADPAHPDGAIAAVEDRGVVFVRVEAR